MRFHRVLPCAVALWLAVFGCSSDDDAASNVTKGPSAGGDGGSADGTVGVGPDGSSGDDGSAPAGDGIAAKYPGDVGIENDPDVIFADGFETYASASDLAQKWDNYFQASQTKIVTDARVPPSRSDAPAASATEASPTA